MSESFSLLPIFQQELELHSRSLHEGCLELEKGSQTAATLEAMMRAAHSLKGAGHLLAIKPVERLAHALEEVFLKLQRVQLELTPALVDTLLAALDLLEPLKKVSEPELAGWLAQAEPRVEELLVALREPGPLPEKPRQEPVEIPAEKPIELVATDVRLSTRRLDALMHLAGEARILSGRLERMLALSGRWLAGQRDLCDRLRELAEEAGSGSLLSDRLTESRQVAERLLEELREHDEGMDHFRNGLARMASSFQQEVLESRMRPFSEVSLSLRRQVREVARELGKPAELVLEGTDTLVDRDILERLEAPLGHILRNALDHGLEEAPERQAAGKPAAGRVLVTAGHRAGMLSVVVEDDGRGVDVEILKQHILERGLSNPGMLANLSQEELMQFMFLPGFTSKRVVNAISGRGVGLDVVRTNVAELGGQVHVLPRPGLGMRLSLTLPVTLSTASCLIVRVAGEPYALPLSRVDSVLMVRPEEVEERSGQPYLTAAALGVVAASRVLERGEPELGPEYPILVLRRAAEQIGLLVDRLMGVEELVVMPLDPRLRKPRNVQSASLLADGQPVLILDPEDVITSAERLRAAGGTRLTSESETRRKSVLVVDDSITVREVERNTLELQGYRVEVAVDGLDGLGMARSGTYDLVVTDIDMPRMDGLQLVRELRADPRYREVPIIVVSYKDREEDRQRGLEAGADYYITKGSFQDEGFMQAVLELIGPP